MTRAILAAALVGLATSVASSMGMSIIPRSVATTNILARAAEVKAEYDYVIVGGGTAGLVVADRLSESGKYTVLVIELGFFDNSTSTQTVAGGAASFGNRTHIFSFNSVPQINLQNRTTSVVGGVMLGGSSGVNGLQVHRGQKEDYDSWGHYFSNSSEWSWDGLLPYFKKAWQGHPPTEEMVKQFGIKYDASYWGDASARVDASFPTFSWPFLKTEMDAYGEIPGVEYPIDSGAGYPGVFWYPMSADPRTMTRSLSRNGYWDGIKRENYETITGQKVLRVNIADGKATGVTFVAAGARSSDGSQVVGAKKEVIVAAGTIHTPQVLQGSGIGPKAVLEAAKIEVKVDLPGVGSNFQDHPLPGAQFNFSNFPIHPDPTDLQSNNTFMQAAQAEFLANRTGPLTIASGNAASFLPFSVIAPEMVEDIASRYEAQDPAAYLPTGIDKTVVAGYAAQKRTLAKQMRSKGSAWYNLFLRGSYQEGALVYLHPLSRGTIYVDAVDPYFREPVVDYRALSNPADLDVLVEFTRFTRKYFLETSLSRYAPRETRPGANLTLTADIAAAARAAMSPTCFHPVGTAPMMPRELGGVVDEKLLVYGVEGLSVVDASIMPALPGAYTQQTVYAVAEKAADLIKARA